MIKAIIFDFDGMVFVSDLMFSERLSRDFGIPKEDIKEFFKNEFSECQKGNKDLKKSLSPYLSKWGWEKSVEDLLDYWFEYGQLDEEMIKLINQLRNHGVVCVLGTNNERYRMSYLEGRFKISGIFDFVVVSCDIGARKPDRAFYDKILRDTKLNPEEIIVFDDKEEHILELQKMNFIPMIYRGMEEFRNNLEKLRVF